MSRRVLYTGTRPPSGDPRLTLGHAPALRVSCAQIEADQLPASPFVAVFFTLNAVVCVFAQPQAWHGLIESAVAVGARTAMAIDDAIGVHVYTPMAADYEGVLLMLGGDGPWQSLPIVAFELRGGPRRLSHDLPQCLSVDAYETHEIGFAEFEAQVRAFGPDWVIVASPRAAALVAQVSGPEFRTAAIGPTTCKALQSLGIEPDLMPDSPSLSSTLDDIANWRGR